MSGASLSTAIKLKRIWRIGVAQGGVFTTISKSKRITGAAVYPERGIDLAVYQQQSYI